MNKRICLALVLGASEFPGLLPDQGPNEAFRNSAGRVEQYFGAQRNGAVDYRVASLFDSDLNVIEQGGKVEELLKENADATDLIVYYVGHGGFVGGREYYLALKSTRQSMEHLTCLRISSLSAIINRWFTNRRLFILLDCCFAGTAVNEWQSIPSLGRMIESRALRHLPPHGTAMLVASSKDEPAISPRGRPYTMFCECLLEVLNQGIEGAGPTMSLHDVADHLRVLVNARFGDYGSIPEIHSPRQRAGDIAKWPLFPNPAYTAPSLPEDLIAALGNPLPKVRAGAVGTLEDYVSAAADLSLVAFHELERIAKNDDSTLVKKNATEVLARIGTSSFSVTGLPTGTGDHRASLTGSLDLVDENQHEFGQPGAEGNVPHEPPNAAPTHDAAFKSESAVPRHDRQILADEISPKAALAVSIWPSQRRIPEDGQVTWTCKVSNTGAAPVRSIEVTDAAGTQLHRAFDLGAAQARRFKFSRRYGQQGGRMTIAVLGRTDHDILVSAEGSGVVSVLRAEGGLSRTSLHLSPAPQSGPPDLSTAASRAPSLKPTQTTGSDLPRSPADTPRTDNAIVTASIDAPRFREAVRSVKVTAKLGDMSVNRALRLIGEGERHYRVTAGQLTPPPEWHHRVVDWAADVSAFGTDELVMVKLKPPSRQEIVQNLHRLACHIHGLTGVRIPIDEFDPERKESEQANVICR
jgi:hypothetical protein